MLTYVVRRLLYSVLVLIAASFIIFSFVRLVSDPLAFLRMQPRVSEQTIRNIEERKHLNDPIPVQYLYWARDALLHQFGTTTVHDRPILPDIWRVMKNTIQLVLTAEILALLIAVGIGVYSALRQYSFFDYAATTFSFVGLATPVFWLALMLQVLFVNIYLWFDVRIFYTSNLSSVDPGPTWSLGFLIDRIQHLALPVITLAVASIATYSRYMRASMLEVVNADYVRTARAKGLPERRVTMKHAFRNALIPLVTVVALNFGSLLGGAIVTETVFSLDGMGFYFIQALGVGDPYPIMAWLMVTSTAIIVFNLVADIAYGFLDPRVRYD
ncbi:MAG TPA: ABC transporter permease [Gaiellaceae bacterium]|nr:ABC transporter permease [Gaiellaceae bacterium]